MSWALKWTTRQILILYILLVGFIQEILPLLLKGQNQPYQHFANTWVLQINGDEHAARMTSKKLGFKYLGPMGSLKNYYMVQHYRNRSKRSKRNVELKSRTLNSFPLRNGNFRISSVQQQRILSRQKRDYTEDPLYKDQWYLNNTGQTYSRCSRYKDGSERLDINVGPVWAKNITGKGVVVSILDDGIEYTHPDLIKSYNPEASYDYNNYDKDPIPRYDADNTNKHGTRCAGEIVGERGNGVCGVGVAYGAKVAGIRMLDGEVSDAVEGASLSYAQHIVDIYSISWGPDDNGRTFDGPATFANAAFKKGVENGRNGLGSIFVWATGNGGVFNDFCSCDGYINSIYTIAIGAVDNCGKKPWYAEPCPGTIAVTYSSGEKSLDRQIITTDLRKKCTSAHTGTSGAAPLAAGIFALVLEANSGISWRDLQHLIVKTSSKVDVNDPEWRMNGAGYHFNIKYGFGALDAMKLVEAAQNPNWRTARPQQILEMPTTIVHLHSIGYNEKTVHSNVHVKTCVIKKRQLCVDKLEHVHVIVTVTLNPSRNDKGYRGHLSIVLTSPAGTESEILRQRRLDVDRNNEGFTEWEFLTLFHWGESPVGVWKLSVTDHSGENWYLKKHLSWKLKLYGTSTYYGFQ